MWEKDFLINEIQNDQDYEVILQFFDEINDFERQNNDKLEIERNNNSYADIGYTKPEKKHSRIEFIKKLDHINYSKS